MLDVGHQRQRALIIALLASLLLWNLPFGGLVLYPFKLLATWLHEMSHGLIMILTGAGFEHLEIYRDTSGVAQATRGVSAAGRAAIACAGYTGTAVFGGLLLVVGQTRRGARSVMAMLGVTLAVTAYFFILNDFGAVAAYIAAGTCVGIALVPSERLAVLLVNFIAAQACINALLDIRVLFRTEMVINGEVVIASDAHNMAASTFGTHWMWAGIWLAWSFLSFYIALRIVYLRHVALEQRAAHVAGNAEARASASMVRVVPSAE